MLSLRAEVNTFIICMFSCQVFLFCFIGLCSYTGININYWGLISFFSYVKCRFPLPPCSFPFSWLLLLFFLHKSFRFDLSDSVFFFSPWDWIKYINSGKVEISDIDYSLLWKLRQHVILLVQVFCVFQWYFESFRTCVYISC